MQIGCWGRCDGAHLEALQGRLFELVRRVVVQNFEHEDPAAFVASAFVGPPFVEDSLYVFRSKMWPHNIMMIAAVPDLSAGVQYTLIMPDRFDTRVIFPTVRDQMMRLW